MSFECEDSIVNCSLLSAICNLCSVRCSNSYLLWRCRFFVYATIVDKGTDLYVVKKHFSASSASNWHVSLVQPYILFLNSYQARLKCPFMTFLLRIIQATTIRCYAILFGALSPIFCTNFHFYFNGSQLEIQVLLLVFTEQCFSCTSFIIHKSVIKSLSSKLLTFFLYFFAKVVLLSPVGVLYNQFCCDLTVRWRVAQLWNFCVLLPCRVKSCNVNYIAIYINSAFKRLNLNF